MYYSHKRFLVSVTNAEEDGVLITQSGIIPIKANDIIACDQLGNSYVLQDEDLYNNYLPVRKMRKTRQKTNLDDIAKGYIEMGYLVEESNKNDENYIFDPQLISDKAF